MATIGACLVANEPTALGKAMLQARADGKSWKEIADEFDLPNPSAARKAFEKHTGISDFKTKGPAIFNVKPGPAQVAKDLTEKVVQQGAKDAAEAFKPNTIANAPSPPQAKPLDALSSKHEQIVEEFKKGKGYTAISQSTGAEFKEIDESVWRYLLEQEPNADVDPEAIWKAYKKKPTSESGLNAVKTQVNDFKLAGFTTKEISEMTGVPESVIDAIGSNTWHAPAMGATQPFIPPPPPPPPATYVYEGPLPPEAARGYNWPDDGALQQWINGLGRDLTAEDRAVVRAYTNSHYSTINGAARNGRHHDDILAIDRAMRPIPGDMRLRRDTSYSAVFGGMDPQQLVGSVIADPGFFSTTIKQGGVFSGDLVYMIDAPAGTMGRYVQGSISSHSSEYELILGRDTKMLVTKVEVSGSGYGRKIFVYCQVLL